MEHTKSDRANRTQRQPSLRVLRGGVAEAARRAQPAPSVRVDPAAQAPPSLLRHALVPLTLLLAAGAYYGLRWPLAAVVALGAGLMLVQAWIGVWTTASQEALDRALLSLLSSGRAAALVPRVRAAWMFRAFGSPAEVAERFGRAHREAGEAATAQAHYARAIALRGGCGSLALVSGLGLSAYDAGDDRVAIDALRAALEAAPDLLEPKRRLAHALVRSGRAAEAEALYDAGPDRERVRALGLALAGRGSEARRLVRDLGPGGVLTTALEAALALQKTEARGKARGKSERKRA